MSDIEAAKMAVENHELRRDHVHLEAYQRILSLEARLAILESTAAEQTQLAQAAAVAAEENAAMAEQAAEVAEHAAAAAEETAAEETGEDEPIEEASSVVPDTIPEVTHPVFRRVGGTRA
jgi:hypothetical protein